METLHLVAHRGYAARYPENTLLALEKAIEAGARYLELDVQLSADGVPLILHDANLQRTGGVEVCVLDEDWADLQQYGVGEPQRFGDEFADTPLSPLSALEDLLGQYPDVNVFVELKEESLERFGRDRMLTQVLFALQPVRSRCVIISYDHLVLNIARNRNMAIGWIVREWGEENRARAQALQPEFVICNQEKIQLPLWDGPWQWFVYEITDATSVRRWAEEGVTFFESMDVQSLVEQLT